MVMLIACWPMLWPSTARAEPQAPPDDKAGFLKLCDLAYVELNKPVTPYTSAADEDPKTHHVPFFEDSYGVRALCVAYDLTGKKEYLDACMRWTDRIIDCQDRMTPKGAYHMNYCGVDQKMDWYVADSGSIAMAVLATAVRTTDAPKRERYLKSIRSFARLVIDNYVGKDGGIINGTWSSSSGEYWCATATFGPFVLLAHAETKDPEYLKIGLDALDWMNRHDFRKVEPLGFTVGPTCVVFYVFEFYAAATPYLDSDSPRRKAAEAQSDEAFKWLAKNQKGRGAKSDWDYFGRDTYVAGYPYLMYVLARNLPQHADQAANADQELRYVHDLLWKDGNPPKANRLTTWEVMTWAMMSYAEKLSPGALFRTSKP
jgi:hypothetical protein